MLSTSLDIVNGRSSLCFLVFFFNDTATTEIYTLSLHDALPIWLLHGCRFKLADGFGIHRLLFVRPSEVHVSPETGGLDLRSEEHTAELQSPLHLVCRLLLEKKKNLRPQELLQLCRDLRGA